MNFSEEYFMKMAYREAEKAMEKDEIPVGAVVVLNQMVIGRGHNLTQTLQDVTAHAEMQAITAATNHIGAKYLNDCTLYVTLEPCVMCAGAIAWAQLGSLVYGAADPKKGFTLVKHNILHPKTLVKSGIMEQECSEILIEFFNKKRK
ncbi:MAG TPA: nucleoside deaminase [Bacteroidales bacterium]|nr:nucleoside deaminase [Bacteroidales bacterium]HPS71222.1 nucleoside deaminase [Bacteroidales bacterium]